MAEKYQRYVLNIPRRERKNGRKIPTIHIEYSRKGEGKRPKNTNHTKLNIPHRYIKFINNEQKGAILMCLHNLTLSPKLTV